MDDVWLHDFLLDAFPVCDELELHNPLLAASVSCALLDAWTTTDAGVRRASLVAAQQVLTLARDLGYLNDVVASYLLRSLHQGLTVPEILGSSCTQVPLALVTHKTPVTHKTAARHRYKR